MTTVPASASRPSSSRVCRPSVTRAAATSSRQLAGPVSQASTGSSSSRTMVTLAMPPRSSAARGPPGAASHRASRVLASGAPRPPAATSRARRSEMTGRPVRSATQAGWPICRVPTQSPSRTSWNTVCPGETTRCGGRSSIAMVVSTASATAWPMRWSRKHSAAADVVAGGCSARICSRSPSGQGCERHSTVSMLTLLSSRPRSTTATSRSSAEVPDATAHTLIAVPPPAGRRRRGRDRRS